MPSTDSMLREVIRQELTDGRNRTSLSKASGAEGAKQKAVAVEEKADRALSVTEPAMLPRAPAAPAGLTVTPWGKALQVEWEPPPQREHVTETEVRLYENPPPTPGEIAERHLTNAYSHTSVNLLLKEYEVWVRHIDRWGREGEWATTLATPLPTIADRITADTLALGREFADLLNNPELLAFRSPDKLASATVEAIRRASAGEYGADANGIIYGRLIAARSIVGEQMVAGTITAESAVLARGAVGNLEFDRASGNRIRILNGDIVNLSVSKLDGGVVSGQDFIFANDGGVRSANNDISLRSGGLSMRHSGTLGRPSQEIERKITSYGEFSALSFYNSSSLGSRGLYIHSEGGGGVAHGGVYLAASRAGSLTDPTTAVLDLNSSGSGGTLIAQANTELRGRLDVRDGSTIDGGLSVGPNGINSRGGVTVGPDGVLSRGRVTAQENLSVAGNMVVEGRTIPNYTIGPANLNGNGSFATFDHNFGFVPYRITAQYTVGGGRWYESSTSGSGIWLSTTTNQARLDNTRAGAITYRMMIWA